MLSAVSDFALRIGHDLERRIDSAWSWGKKRLGWLDPVTIQPFRGYGDGRRARARGRVLEETGLKKQKLRKGTLSNAIQMFHRFESDEIAGAVVEARFQEKRLELKSDEEGYLDVAFDGLADAPSDELVWQDLTLELIEPYRPRQPRPVRIDAPVLIPSADADFALISDIDDTILKTGATSLLRNLRTTLFSSVDERVAFRGLASFYRAMQQGLGTAARNPIFYVSSSPWNLYDLLEEFMTLNDIPIGPLFLRDLGIDDTKFIKSGHDDHKLAAIETLMDFYPRLRFILVGDSGQHDATIYRTVVERHPDRILAVYIRALDEAPERDANARAELDRIEHAGVQAALCSDLLLAAENAAAMGWISAWAVSEVRADIEQLI